MGPTGKHCSRSSTTRCRCWTAAASLFASARSRSRSRRPARRSSSTPSSPVFGRSGGLLDPQAMVPLRDELSWLADCLGEVRDLDVLSERLDRQLADLGPDDRANGALLIARLGVERVTARDRLLDALGSPRYF